MTENNYMPSSTRDLFSWNTQSMAYFIILMLRKALASPKNHSSSYSKIMRALVWVLSSILSTRLSDTLSGAKTLMCVCFIY